MYNTVRVRTPQRSIPNLDWIRPSTWGDNFNTERPGPVSVSLHIFPQVSDAATTQYTTASSALSSSRGVVSALRLVSQHRIRSWCESSPSASLPQTPHTRVHSHRTRQVLQARIQVSYPRRWIRHTATPTLPSPPALAENSPISWGDGDGSRCSPRPGRAKSPQRAFPSFHPLAIAVFWMGRVPPNPAFHQPGAPLHTPHSPSSIPWMSMPHAPCPMPH